MRTILYKNGFIRYFASLLEYCDQGKRKRSFYGMFILFLIASFFLDASTWTWGSALIFVGITTYLGELRNTTPNVISLSPYSPKQKLIYAWLAPVLYFALVISAMIIIRVFFICIFSLYGFLVGFDVAPMWEYSFEFEPVRDMGVYGVLFGLIAQIACYSAGMFSSFIKKWGYRVIATFVFCSVAYLCLQFMSLPYSLTLEKGIRFVGFFMASPFYGFGYEYMQYPWLAVVLCGVASLAFLGFTIWFTALRSRGKDY